MADFLHRPAGTDALPTAGSVARTDQAVRAVLRTADGGVLISSIARRPDGSFSGEVYGVTPRERAVAVGDRVTFSESQIFTYKTSGGEGTSRDEVERAQMIRAFGEAFRDAAAPSTERTAPEPLAPDDFAFEPVAAPAAPRAEPPRAPAEPEISVDDAYALLGGARVEPVWKETPEPVVPPPVVEQPPPAPAPEPPAPVEAAPVPRETIACMECGATLVVPTTEGGPPAKVSCGRCGRINSNWGQVHISS
ncbi:MAG TPA: hypothetical protein VHP37_11795 [Burkholderiales bacterium]|nr:hypothetical protein [Burkholderiales bacterium]